MSRIDTIDELIKAQSNLTECRKPIQLAIIGVLVDKKNRPKFNKRVQEIAETYSLLDSKIQALTIDLIALEENE